MANRTIRYGVSLRKLHAGVAAEKTARYMCDMCEKKAVKSVETSIWVCRHCRTIYAGGAYSFKTAAGTMASRILGQFKSG